MFLHIRLKYFLKQNQSDGLFKVWEHCDEGHVPESDDEVESSGKVNDGEIVEIKTISSSGLQEISINIQA